MDSNDKTALSQLDHASVVDWLTAAGILLFIGALSLLPLSLGMWVLGRVCRRGETIRPISTGVDFNA